MTKPSKTQIETGKTVIIAVLVTAVAMFVAGMQYNVRQTAKADARVHAAVEQMSKNQ